MKTEEIRKSAGYQGIIANLMALKQEVEATSKAEAEVIQGILANLIALQGREAGESPAVA